MGKKELLTIADSMGIQSTWDVSVYLHIIKWYVEDISQVLLLMK